MSKGAEVYSVQHIQERTVVTGDGGTLGGGTVRRKEGARF